MSKTLSKLSSVLLSTTLAATVASASGGELAKVMKKRGLTENDVIRAAKTTTQLVVEMSLLYLVLVVRVDKSLFTVFHL